MAEEEQVCEKSRDDLIKLGDLYENCKYHPCLCVEADYEIDDLLGISLIDGNFSCCSLLNCGPRRLTVEEAVKLKKEGPGPPYERDIPDHQRWWETPDSPDTAQ